MSQLWQFALVGLASGGAYALVALGVVAVYRGSGILNFSQGAIGMIGSYVFFELDRAGNGPLPVVPALLIGVVVGALLGLVFYLTVIRYLRNASDMAKVVATLGFTLLLETVAGQAWGDSSQSLGPIFGSGEITIFGAVMTYDTLALVLFTVALAIGLALMFGRTRLGITATALKENTVAASTIGISPHPTAIVTWTLGGAMAAFAGSLLIPVIGLAPANLTLLVIPAMAAALIARFSLMSVTVVVGLAMGVAQSVMQEYNVNAGINSSLPFAVIIVAVVLGGRALPGRGELLNIRLPRVGNGRIKPSSVIVLTALGIVLSVAVSPTWSTAMINTAIFGLLGLSIVVVTGFAGQISVASAALAGFGSFIAAQCSSNLHLPFLPCVALGTAAAVVLGVVVGAPAVRVRGINLAIVTLGLSLAVEYMVLQEPNLTNNSVGLAVTQPSLFGYNLNPATYPDRFTVMCVIVLALGSLAVANLRRGQSGRRYVAVRANERGAASVGLSVAGVKLGAFAVSAALAGLSGALATFRFQIADFSNYDVFDSINALAFTVVGGVGFVGGAIFAAANSADGVVSNFFSNVLNFSAINNWLPTVSGFFVLLNIIVVQGDGVILLMGQQNALMYAKIKRLLPLDGHRIAVLAPQVAAPALGLAAPDVTGPDVAGRATGLATGEPLLGASQPATATLRGASLGAKATSRRVPLGETVLVARNIRISYGNVRAVDDVSLELTAGQVLGVVGPNGAGKTSLIDGLTGFTGLSGGTIELCGQDATKLRASQRARKGLGRTFQNLELFDDLSVRENILTALDSHSRLSYASDLFYPGRNRLTPAAMAAVSMLDLERDLDVVVADLPQGRRRMVAIARLIAQEPVAMLLDEPAAGLSGAERRTACELFRALADDLGAAVLLVEHNIDVVATTCDHLIVLDFGRVIASGPTAEVLRLPAVREAYLGRLSSTGSDGDSADRGAGADHGAAAGPGAPTFAAEEVTRD